MLIYVSRVICASVKSGSITMIYWVKYDNATTETFVVYVSFRYTLQVVLAMQLAAIIPLTKADELTLTFSYNILGN